MILSGLTSLLRRGARHEDCGYLPLTTKVIESHLRGEVHVGLYPRLDGDLCWWPVADFDKEEALFDAFMYVKAGRAPQAGRPRGVPLRHRCARLGFLHLPVPAETARWLGTGLLREAMSLRGRMSLASYDRLFPSQDLIPPGGDDP